MCEKKKMLTKEYQSKKFIPVMLSCLIREANSAGGGGGGGMIVTELEGGVIMA